MKRHILTLGFLAGPRVMLALQKLTPDEPTSPQSAQIAETAAKQVERIKELEFRRDLARDELRRSEGQLNLIKDLLLRGDRL